MNNKGAVTLSVNFLVVIILAIVILSLSVYFLTSIIGKAKSIGEMAQSDLDKQIENIQCEGVVCVPVNYKQIKAGEFDIFGVKIYNAGPPQTFSLIVNATGTNLPHKPDDVDVTLKQNQEKRIGIGFEVPKGTPKGIYIFNVMVFSGDNQYAPTQQIRVEVS